MKKSLIYGALAVASLGFTACSSDDVQNDEVRPSDKIEMTAGFKPLANFQFDTPVGKANGGSADARSMEDIDGLYRPTSKYSLNHIVMLAMNPSKQPTSNDLGNVVDLGYSLKNSVIQKHSLAGNHSYQLQYTTENPKTGESSVVDNSSKGASNSGTIYLKHKDSPDYVAVDLTVFDLKKLHAAKDEMGKQLALNDFAYDLVDGDLRGTTLRYASFLPQDIANQNNDPDANPEGLTGRYVQLEEITDDALVGMLTNPNHGVSRKIYQECKDEFFSGDEFIVAADNEKIYLLRTVLNDNETGGYYKVRAYPTAETSANPDKLALNRLTTMVNASFMLVNEESVAPYYVEKDEVATLTNFKKTYGVDLSDLTCAAATIDGLTTQFYINEPRAYDKTTKPGRLVLWAPGHEVTAANGKTVTKVGEASMNVAYSHGGDLNVESRGYGILGKSYAVAFPSNGEDTSDQLINFYVTVGGTNVLIKAKMPSTAPLTFDKNASHNIIVLVPAQKFADAVKSNQAQITRSNGQEYVELNLSSDCVVIQ